jgi:hypothetical protein
MKSEAEIRDYLKLREYQLDELYEIIESEEGNMGDVWEQIDVTLGNIEAIKFVLGETQCKIHMKNS